MIKKKVFWVERGFFIFLVFTFLISFISASDLGTFKRGECINLHQICDNCTYVNLTSITYPNSTILEVGELMTKRGVDYNYTFCNDTTVIGEFIYNTCGDQDGSEICENIKFSINAIGKETTDARSDAAGRGIYVLFGIATLFFLGFLFTPSEKTLIDEEGRIKIVGSNITMKWSFFLLSVFFIMLGVNITFISIYNDIGDTQIGAIFDKLAAISTYMYWFVFGLLIFIWVFAILATLADKQRMKQAKEVGEPIDFGGY